MSRPARLTTVTALLAALAASAAAAQEPGVGAYPYTFRCADGREVTVRYQAPLSETERAEEQRANCPQDQPSASAPGSSQQAPPPQAPPPPAPARSAPPPPLTADQNWDEDEWRDRPVPPGAEGLRLDIDLQDLRRGDRITMPELRSNRLYAKLTCSRDCTVRSEIYLEVDGRRPQLQVLTAKRLKAGRKTRVWSRLSRRQLRAVRRARRVRIFNHLYAQHDDGSRATNWWFRTCSVP